MILTPWERRLLEVASNGTLLKLVRGLSDLNSGALTYTFEDNSFTIAVNDIGTIYTQ